MRIFHCRSRCSNVSSFLVCSFSFKCFNFVYNFSCSDIAVNVYVSKNSDVSIDHSKNSHSQKVA